MSLAFTNFQTFFDRVAPAAVIGLGLIVAAGVVLLG